MATPPTRTEIKPATGSSSAQLPLPQTGKTLDESINLNAPDSFVPDWVPTSPPIVEAAPLTSFLDTPLPEALAVPVDIEIENDEEDDDDPIAHAVDAAPPWLISLAVHMALIVILGLLVISQALITKIDLEATFAPTFGEQVEEQTFEFDNESLADQQILSTDMTMADDPLASPHTEAPDFSDQLLASSTFEAPNIGLALSGREAGMKETLLLAYGGNATTEAAVAEALKWLEKNQLRDGSWRLDGPYKDGSAARNPLAATSMALLAFQGAGFTHKSTRVMLSKSGTDRKEVDYRRVVRLGWKKMLEWQDADGNFWRKGRVDHPHHKLYSQAQATIAICELYGMTKDEDFRRPAQLAVNYACDIQDQDGIQPNGGWKYDPRVDSDLSVTGWFVMALQSARMAGLDVPSDVFDKVAKFLDSVTDEGSYYAYMPGYNSKPALTAEGLLCRQYMGWRHDDERLIEGVEYLSRHEIDWDDSNTYYWYYATQVMHHMEGDYWFDWNEIMSKEIPANQVKNGAEKGSWSPKGDIWGQGGGRLYMTCLCTYMLEVYYRHLPIYSKAF